MWWFRVLLTRANGAIPQSISAASTDPVQKSAIDPAKRERTRPSQSVRFQTCHHASQADATNPDTHSASRVAQDEESPISFLPSTVPETMDEMMIPDEIEVETEDREAHAQDTQFSNATQPVSQTAWDDVITRSRSEQHSLPPDLEPPQAAADEKLLPEGEGADLDADEDEDLQDSIQEGDSNFLDICSSFAAAPNAPDSVPLNFFPTQTQHQYTQFRESQRFKTPATAGRKRDHAGNFTDTPIESRNPFARNGKATPGNMVGLSQLIDNTQATSSPFPVAPTSELRSDKPSPGIVVERHVAGLPTSSPLQMLSDPRKSSEPASRYVPVGQSQALRRAMASEAEENEGTQGSTTDEFDSVLSIVERQRRAREREARARKELEAASSPMSPQKHDPIKIGKLPRRAESERPIRTRPESGSESLPSSPPALVTEETVEDLTETAADDEPLTEAAYQHVPQELSPLATSPVVKRSKKKVTTLVPDTTKRTTRSTAEPRHNVQPSPSEHRTRYGQAIVHIEPISSNPIRVANSQRSIPSTQEPNNKPVASSAESVDVIPASPEGNLQSTEPSTLQHQLPTEDVRGELMTEADHEDHETAVVDEIRPSGLFNSAIPETSSSGHNQSRPKGSTYLTALTNQPTEAIATAVDWSSQPVRATPPGRKRKRLDELSQEVTLPTASQSTAFDPAEVLALDRDPDIAKALSSQDPDPIRPRRRVRLDPPIQVPPIETQESMPNGTVNSANIGRQLRSKNVVADDDEEDLENALPSSSLTELTELPETPSLLKTPARKAPPKSIYDLGDSPQPRTAPISMRAQTQLARLSLQEAASGRNGRVISKTKLRTPKPIVNALPPIVETSPDPIAISTASPAVGTPIPNTSEVVAPQMVFVYFMNKTAKTYHPAICHGYSDETKEYTIEWPGYAPEQMEKHKICSLDLRIGDEVKVDYKKWPRTIFRIHGFGPVKPGEEQQGVLRDIYGHTTVLLEPKDPKISIPKGSNRNEPVPIGDVYLMANQFTRVNKRPFVCSTKDAPEVPALIPRPSTPQIRTSIPSTPSSRSRKPEKDVSVQPAIKEGIFSNMVFALSMDEEDERKETADLVRDQGGVILESTFQDLVSEDMRVRSHFKNFSFAALLADRHSRKPKYMQALAFGLPCLSRKWVEVSVKRQRLASWQDYLLPAGESDELYGAVRSRVLPPMDVSIGLSGMVDKRPRFFTDANIVFIRGRGKAEEKRKPYLFFVRVMDAAKVEQVTDLVAARLYLEKLEKKGKTWVVVDDRDLEAARDMVDGLLGGKAGRKKAGNNTDGWECRVADGKHIMQSLILGRLCELDEEE